MGSVFPGCVALVWRDGATLYHEAHGAIASHSRVVHAGKSARRDTIYDLASLTKVLCTTTLAAIAVSEGALELDAPVPEPWAAGCPGATLAHVLEHCAGFEAHREFFTEVEPYDADAVLERVAATPPAYPLQSKSIYSDLGFMVLGRWLEQVFGGSLQQVFADRIAYALSLESSPLPQLGFRPQYGLPALSEAHERLIAPTEVYEAQLHPHGVPSHFERRRSVLCAHGAVHDDNAFVMGGVAGHAGLFGTAAGVLEVARGWLLGLLPGIKPAVRERFWQASDVAGSTRRLGWDGASADGSGSAGTAASNCAVGHTGYTGTSLWIDPAAARGPTICVLLSNRVHPTRSNDAIRGLRQRFHEAAFAL